MRAEAVVVLEAPHEAGWKEGVQALVAELLTTGYELSVRAARGQSLEQVQRELQLLLADSGASAGVSVMREASHAVALLCRREAASCERLRLEISDGELSRSRLALSIVERLRPLDLTAAPRAQPAPPPVAPTQDTERTQDERPEARTLRAWVGAGVVLSSGPSGPIPWLSASLGLMVAEPWGLELELAGSPLPGRADSRAGSVELRGFEATAFATFEPFSRRRLGFSLGLGGGALRLQETPSPAPGFDGASQGVTVSVVSARARLLYRLGPAYWAVVIDPGMLVPSVKVAAGTETVLRIGRPWISAQTSLGLEL
jgi:hypothetical protein